MARKRREPVPEEESLNCFVYVRFKPAEHKALQKLAEDEGRSMAAQVRQLVKPKLEAIVGRAKSSPAIKAGF